MGGEPLGGPAVHRARGTALQGPLDQLEIARSPAGRARHGEVEGAGLLELSVAAQPVRLQEVAPQPGEERRLAPAARRREARQVAAGCIGPSHPLPGLRIVRQHGESLAPVGGGGEPGIEEAGEVLRIAQHLGEQAAGDLPLARRQRRPDLQVGGGEEARRLPPRGRQAEGGLERRLPPTVGGEQPRVLRPRPADVGGGPLHQGGLPGGGAPGQDLARRLRGLRHARRGLARRLLPGDPLGAGGIELRGQHGPGGPQPHPLRVRLAAERRRVEGDAGPLQPRERRLPRRLEGPVPGGRDEGEPEPRQGQARAHGGSSPAGAGGWIGGHGGMVAVVSSSHVPPFPSAAPRGAARGPLDAVARLRPPRRSLPRPRRAVIRSIR